MPLDRPLIEFFRRNGARSAAAAAAFLGAALLAALLFRLALPRPLFADPFSLAVYDSSGALLGASIAADDQWRLPPAEKVPDKFQTALLASEDARFRTHPGIDVLALARAGFQNLASGEVKSGGSTISMQVIRLRRRETDRSLPEKLVEAALALRLETEYRKDEILLLFAAHAPFGGNIVGLESAAWRYFGRSPAALSWAESALLAVLPNSPGLIHLGRNRPLLKAKRDRLLEKLARLGHLSPLDCRLAKDEPLPEAPRPLPRLAPHLLARLEAMNRSEPRPEKRTWRAVTTLDASLQADVNRILERHIAQLRENGIHNAAACVLETDTGRALAYVGNTSEEAGDRTHAADVDILASPRSTGSLLKPFLYAALLDQGELLPDQLVPDIPTRYGGFRPENDTRSFRGAVKARFAIAQSLNIPSVRLLKDFGLDRFYSYLTSLGMSTLFRPAQEYGLTLVLGGAEGTLWELSGMYAGLGRAARLEALSGPAGQSAPFFPPRFLAEGEAPRPEGGRTAPAALSPGAAWLTLEAMLEVERPGEDVNWRAFDSTHRIAWKTGTSFGHRDAWSIGVTPRYTVGVWAGNATGEGRAGLRGSLAAAPILFDIYNRLDDSGWFPEPAAALALTETCAKSGFPRGPHCEAAAYVKAPRVVRKTGACPYCTLIHLDKSGRYRVTSQCERVSAIEARPWFILPPAMEWYYKAASADYRPVPPWRPDCRPALGDTGVPSLSIIFPAEGSLVYIPLELDGRRGKIVCSAAHREPRAALFWHLDGAYLGTTAGLHQWSIQPLPGEHTLTVVDENGEFAQKKFKVLAKEKR